MSSESISSPKQVRLFNASFDPFTLDETVDAVFSRIVQGKRGWLSTINVAILMTMRRDAELKSFVDRGLITVADGQPLVWCAPWFGGRLPERVTGIDLIDPICARAARDDIGVFLLGATSAVIAQVTALLHQRHPCLRLSSADGYFSSAEVAERTAAIRTSGARILIVGMGVPRQERFIAQNWEALGVDLALGVGGSFDVLAGVRRRAPAWVQQICMEWAFRLIQEPRRLFWRYLTTNTLFLWVVVSTFLRSVAHSAMGKSAADV